MHLGEREVFVVGPSRSGTSVVARAVNLLGSSLCVPADLHSGHDNPDGHWESRTVIAINDRLLASVNGSWALPPTVPAPSTWSSVAPAEAASSFRSVHEPKGWVCKDPRLCITLPYWIDALGVDPVVVLVLRAPAEVASSLARDGMPVAHGVALWERYLLHALHGARRRRLITVQYDELLNAPEATMQVLAAELAAAGACASLDRVDEAASAVAPTSRPPIAVDVTDHQQRLWAAVRDFARSYQTFDEPVPEESAWTSELLRAITAERWLAETVETVEARGGLRRAMRRVLRRR